MNTENYVRTRGIPLLPDTGLSTNTGVITVKDGITIKGIIDTHGKDVVAGRLTGYVFTGLYVELMLNTGLMLRLSNVELPK